MVIKYDYLSRETPKAVQLVKDELFCWIPKSCLVGKLQPNSAEVIDTFLVEWKDESYKIVRTEGEIGDREGRTSVGRETRQIVVNDENRDLLWEYV